MKLKKNQLNKRIQKNLNHLGLTCQTHDPIYETKKTL
jgi:hypothetical protein